MGMPSSAADCYQVLGLGDNLGIHFLRSLVDIRVDTVQEGNPHGDGPNIEILLLNHFNGFSNLSNIHEISPYKLCIASKMAAL